MTKDLYYIYQILYWKYLFIGNPIMKAVTKFLKDNTYDITNKIDFDEIEHGVWADYRVSSCHLFTTLNLLKEEVEKYIKYKK